MIKKRMVKKGEVKIESLIKKNFTEEFMRKIYDIYMDDCMSIVEKTKRFDKIFTEEFGDRKDYRRIGEGTNRFVCLLDNHIIKVAYNYLAFIDNMNELAQAKNKPKYLAQAYETNGIILVSEYVTVMDKEEFLENQTAIRNILTILQANIKSKDKKRNVHYILGDMGMSNKNYGNWGKRMNGEIVVLDYGYLYEMNGVDWDEVAKCPVCGTYLEYTDDYSELKCAKEGCPTKVKYTTIRNNFGYARIIENIKSNLDKGKYTKFDKDGSLVVDVMEEEVYEDEPEEVFEMPEDVINKLNLSADKFSQILGYVSNNGFIRINNQMAIKEDLFNNKDLYDEKLFPFILGVVDISEKNIEKYKNDFEKLFNERWNEKYIELKKEHERNKNVFTKEEEEFVDYIDEETESLMEESFKSSLKLVDKYANDESKKITSLDDALGSVIDDCFSNLFMADESKVIDDVDDTMSLDYVMRLLDEEKTMNDLKKEDEEVKELTIEEKLKDRYNKLEDALTELITNHYAVTDHLEDEYVEGDVYRTYINGDKIDYDYSPRVNARNILGGYKINEFAFPLYRHLLNKFDYDTELVDEEYEVIYRIDEEVEKPKDIYSRLENRSIVINQIMNRFEENIPQKSTFINTIGKEINDYYDVVDDYYKELQDSELDVTIDNPEYYLASVNDNSEIGKLIRDAKDDLMDEVMDLGLTMNDVKEKYRIVYYYDIESMMTNTELSVMDIIQSMKFNITNNVKDEIINKYYEENGIVLYDDVFDIFKYNGSFVKEKGCGKCSRLIRPIIKAKLVSKDSNEDSYKPEVFVRHDYKRVVIEQRYEVVFDMADSKDISDYQDLKLEAKKRNLYYTESKIVKYVVKNNIDNLSYGLTSKERELISEYNEMLGWSNIRDIEGAFKKGIYETLDNKYKFEGETKTFMLDLINSDLSEAYSNRILKIHVLELSGTMTRLDYLKHIEG